MSDKGEWISVEDELPEPSIIVLAYGKPNYLGALYVREAWVHCKHKSWVDHESGKTLIVTHWISLPKLPYTHYAGKCNKPEVDDE
jgi:hypothetical protein